MSDLRAALVRQGRNFPTALVAICEAKRAPDFSPAYREWKRGLDEHREAVRRYWHNRREAARNAEFKALPGLSDFVATALLDLQHSEADESCEQGREEHDSGTIYDCPENVFASLRKVYARFREECADHIEAALELEPGEDGLRYRGGSKAGVPMSDEELGGTLWLALVGSGVTFTDDGDAPCLQAMADWARANSREGLCFGDDGKVYSL